MENPDPQVHKTTITKQQHLRDTVGSWGGGGVVVVVVVVVSVGVYVCVRACEVIIACLLARNLASSSGNAVVERVFFHIVCPCGTRHAAVRIQKDSEAAHDQQPQKDEEEEDEDEGSLLFQREERDGLVGPRRRQRAAVKMLGHPLQFVGTGQGHVAIFATFVINRFFFRAILETHKMIRKNHNKNVKYHQYYIHFKTNTSHTFSLTT